MRVWRMMRWNLESEMESLEGDVVENMEGDEGGSLDNIDEVG